MPIKENIGAILKAKKFQVFLSSTYSDLSEERESIVKAILELYHIPIGMEMFSAEDEDQWEIIRRTIEVSDYYILVLGLRYGSKTSDGISFTQKEYEFALDKKIPILAFIMKDTAPLPKSKRDDDLSEINNFREMVLTNSKMAQFWETKDQLIKNVSISLTKQIMQKPGIGWIRGDSIDANEAISKELSILSTENRELRKKIKELESKISLKTPNIELEIKPPVINDEFSSYNRAMMPDALNIKNIDPHLLDFISEQDIEKYNDAIPSQIELDEYNNECEKIYRIKHYSTPLVFDVSNNGTAKANNIFIDIEFSEGLIVYESTKKYVEPESPIPFNPIVRAQSEYIKKKSPPAPELPRFHFQSMLANPASHSILTPLLDSNLKHIKTINQAWQAKLNGKKITLKINNLLHTRYITIDDDFMIAPVKSGKHTMDIRIICEEYEELKTQTIEFET